MNRKTNVLGVAVLMLAPFLFGQQTQDQSSARFPADSPSARELVAWSRLQKPRPVPQPLPPPDNNVPQPDQQTTQSPDSQPQQQTFTGKIVKDGDKYVLKVTSNTTYQLDAQNNAKQYEDKKVRVVGQLDTATNTIHVDRIDLLS